MDTIRPLNAALAKKAKKELNEDPAKLEEEVKALQKWLREQPNIRARTNPQFLLGFLRGCKHRMEKARKKLFNYYSLRDSLPEVYKNRLVDDSVVEMAKLGVALILPKTDGDDGPRIAMIRAAAWDPERFSPYEMGKFGTMLIHVSFNEDDNAMIAGQIGILDVANVPLTWSRFATATHLMFGRKVLTFTEKTSPHRPKGLHVINVPPGVEPIFNTFKHFIPARERKLIKLHPNIESLWEHVPRHLLPEEYGGTNSNVKDITDHWVEKIQEYRDYFIEEATYGAEKPEEIEPAFKDSDFDNINLDAVSSFGSYGTFTALAVD